MEKPHKLVPTVVTTGVPESNLIFMTEFVQTDKRMSLDWEELIEVKRKEKSNAKRNNTTFSAIAHIAAEQAD